MNASSAPVSGASTRLLIGLANTPIDLSLELAFFLCEHQSFERLVGRQQHRRGEVLEVLADFQPEHAVLLCPCDRYRGHPPAC